MYELTFIDSARVLRSVCSPNRHVLDMLASKLRCARVWRCRANGVRTLDAWL